MGKINNALYSSNTCEYETPQDLFDLLNGEFHFTLDVCATSENTKCSAYLSKQDNSLDQLWSGVCWMNPPYGKGIDKWLKKAYLSPATVVCLLPVRSDTKWWHEYCMKGEIRFVNRRLKFKGTGNMASFPSAIVIFGSGYNSNYQSVDLRGG